nr:hypothetical protein [Paracoccus saliphilus]
MNIVRGTMLAAVAALTVAPAAFAQQDNQQRGQQNGLVNVAINDAVDVNDNTVVAQVPVGIAAQVCDIDANVLARQFVGTDDTACAISQETAADNNINY